MGDERRIDMSWLPERIVVVLHTELPRDPKRPHFVQTRPTEHVFVPEAAAASAPPEPGERDA